MNKQNIDLYKLVAAIGEEASLNLITSGIVERHVIHAILKEYKELNKDFYTFTMNAFNDGNNCFEDCIYIESFKSNKFTHSHTMSENADMLEILNKDVSDIRLVLFKKAFQRIVDIHTRFGLRHLNAELWLNVLTNNGV